LPFSFRGRFWQQRANVAFVVRRHALEPTDRNRLGFGLVVFLDTPAPHAARKDGSQVRPRMPGKTLEFQFTM
jgi:hypothetical protein